MNNPSLNLTFRPRTVPQAGTKKFVVEIDADRFERLAADLGLFRSDFLESLERAEAEVRQGKSKRLRGMEDLRAA